MSKSYIDMFDLIENRDGARACLNYALAHSGPNKIRTARRVLRQANLDFESRRAPTVAPTEVVSDKAGASGDPKGEVGSGKPGVAHVSPLALYLEGEVMRGGAVKYGPYNYAEHSMRADIYYDAIMRHMHQWWLGSNSDPESLITHLAHVRACCGILIEQTSSGKLIDNRPKDLASLDQAWDQIGDLIANPRITVTAEMQADMDLTDNGDAPPYEADENPHPYPSLKYGNDEGC